MSQQDMTLEPVKFYDIYAPLPLEEPLSLWLIAGLAVLCGLIIILLILFFLRKKKKKISPYWQTTLQKIEALAPLQQQNPPLYIEEINNLLRSYIETRFDLRPTKQTTNEFFHSRNLLENKEIQHFQQELRHLFDQADMIKFARLSPTKKQLVQMEKSISFFVQQTIPQTRKNNTTRRPL